MPAPSVRIREATPGDVAAVIELCGLLDDLHTESLPHRFRGSSARPRPRQDVSAMLVNPSAVILLAEVEARVVGQVSVEIRDVPDTLPFVPRTYGQVNDLFVRDDMRRLGIAQSLMAAAERWVRARGAGSIELVVYEFNQPALRLYEQLGYTVDFRRLRRPLG
jgi:ribosomal protein S18 acetylase RimI-like enzyme